MPFIGTLPERRFLFQPQPICDIGINDANAWRLNPNYRQVYDKLFVALSQGLKAAPIGVDPTLMGIDENEPVFIKPITNLSGMSLEAYSTLAKNITNRPGSFWCAFLHGQHKSTDCLVKDGEAFWFAHTQAANEKIDARPIYWEIGADLANADKHYLSNWIAKHLSNYTGLCNFEQIGQHIIEVHLRGSNGFFDFYGNDFIKAWVTLMDEGVAIIPPPIPGGTVLSLFGKGSLTAAQVGHLTSPTLSIQIDQNTPDRLAIIRAQHKAEGLNCLRALQQMIT